MPSPFRSETHSLACAWCGGQATGQPSATRIASANTTSERISAAPREIFQETSKSACKKLDAFATSKVMSDENSQPPFSVTQDRRAPCKIHQKRCSRAFADSGALWIGKPSGFIHNKHPPAACKRALFFLALVLPSSCPCRSTWRLSMSNLPCRSVGARGDA